MLTQSNDTSSKRWPHILLVAVGALMLVSVGGIVAFNEYIKWILAEAGERNTAVRGAAEHVGTYFETHCAFPPSLPATVQLENCNSGSTCIADETPLGVWQAEGFEVSRESQYSLVGTRIDNTSYRIIGRHDYSLGGEVHTHEIVVRGYRGSEQCTAELESELIRNEFE